MKLTTIAILATALGLVSAIPVAHNSGEPHIQAHPRDSSSFKLTEEFARSLLDPLATEGVAPLLSVIDPDVEWRIGAGQEDPESFSGTYVSTFFFYP